MSHAWLTRNVWVLSLVSLLQDAASELLYPLLPIYLTTVLGAPPWVVGAVEGAAEGAASCVKVVSGPLGDRFTRRPLIGTGYGLAALGKLIVAAAGAWPGVLVGRVVDRLGKGLRGAPRDALLVDGVSPAERGRVFGFHRTMDTLGAVIGPLLGLAGYEVFRSPDPSGAVSSRDPRRAQRAADRLGPGATAGGATRGPHVDARPGSAAASPVLGRRVIPGRLQRRQLP